MEFVGAEFVCELQSDKAKILVCITRSALLVFSPLFSFPTLINHQQDHSLHVSSGLSGRSTVQLFRVGERRMSTLGAMEGGGHLGTWDSSHFSDN